MAYIVADRVLETSTTTGTGAFALAGAISGFRAFSTVCAVSDTLPYYIEAVDVGGTPTGDWETGIGTYSGANTLTRSSVIASSNANSAVNFSAGTKRIGLSPLASQILGIRGGVLSGPLGLPASITGAAPLNIPHGTAPSSPVDGDIWGTSAGFFGRVSTVTRQFAMTSGAQSFTGPKTLVSAVLQNPQMDGTPIEDPYTITDGASVTIDPADGNIQQWTLGASRTPTLTSITAGKWVELAIDDGTAYTITWTSVTWMTDGGNAPTLKTTGYTHVLLRNRGGTLYGWRLGDGG